MEEGAATEQAGQGKEQRGEERLHWEDATVREGKRSTGSVSRTFLVGTRCGKVYPALSPVTAPTCALTVHSLCGRRHFSVLVSKE